MKKTLTRLAAVGMILCLGLFGCAPKFPKLSPNSPVSLTIWHYYNGMQKTAFDNLVAEFNETVGLEKGVSISAYGQGDVNALTEKVIAAAEKKVGAGEMPNMFAAYADTAYAIDQLGLAAPLDIYFTKEELSQYREEFLDEGRFDKDGSLKIFPIAKSTEVLALNKTDWDKFSAANGAKLEDLATMEGLVRVSQKYYEWTDSLTPATDDGKAFFGRDAMANYMLIGAKQLGCEIFSVKSGVVTVNANKKIFKKLWDNYYIPFIKGYFAANNRFRSDDVKVGTIVALTGSTSGIKYFPDKVSVTDTNSYDIECEVVPAPVFEGGEKYAVQQGAGMVVSKTSAKAEYASAVFLKWFTENERNIEFAAASSYMPVKTAACDADKIIAAEKAQAGEDPKTVKTVNAAVKTLSEYKMYTSKAFDGGIKARTILENSMAKQAVADYNAVLAEIAAGKSKAEAQEQYLQNDKFEQWYASISTELNRL